MNNQIKNKKYELILICCKCEHIINEKQYTEKFKECINKNLYIDKGNLQVDIFNKNICSYCHNDNFKIYLKEIK